MKTRNKKTTYRPYQVPDHLYQKLEQKAKDQRQKTGADVSWTTILRNILEETLTGK